MATIANKNNVKVGTVLSWWSDDFIMGKFNYHEAEVVEIVGDKYSVLPTDSDRAIVLSSLVGRYVGKNAPHPGRSDSAKIKKLSVSVGDSKIEAVVEELGDSASIADAAPKFAVGDLVVWSSAFAPIDLKILKVLTKEEAKKIDAHCVSLMGSSEYVYLVEDLGVNSSHQPFLKEERALTKAVADSMVKDYEAKGSFNTIEELRSYFKNPNLDADGNKVFVGLSTGEKLEYQYVDGNKGKLAFIRSVKDSAVKDAGIAVGGIVSVEPSYSQSLKGNNKCKVLTYFSSDDTYSVQPLNGSKFFRVPSKFIEKSADDIVKDSAVADIETKYVSESYIKRAISEVGKDPDDIWYALKKIIPEATYESDKPYVMKDILKVLGVKDSAVAGSIFSPEELKQIKSDVKSFGEFDKKFIGEIPLIIAIERLVGFRIMPNQHKTAIDELIGAGIVKRGGELWKFEFADSGNLKPFTVKVNGKQYGVKAKDHADALKKVRDALSVKDASKVRYELIYIKNGETDSIFTTAESDSVALGELKILVGFEDGAKLLEFGKHVDGRYVILKKYYSDSVNDAVSYDTLLANWGFAWLNTQSNGLETWYYRENDDNAFMRALNNVREKSPNLVLSSANDGSRKITIMVRDKKAVKDVAIGDANVLGYVVKIDSNGWVSNDDASWFSGSDKEAFLFNSESVARSAILKHNDYFVHKGYDGKIFMWQRLEWTGGPQGTFITTGSRGIPISLVAPKNFDDAMPNNWVMYRPSSKMYLQNGSVIQNEMIYEGASVMSAARYSDWAARMLVTDLNDVMIKLGHKGDWVIREITPKDLGLSDAKVADADFDTGETYGINTGLI